jgi:hypothetical protein
MMRFSFNSLARREALSALRKIQTYVSPAAAALGQWIFPNLADKVAIAAVSLFTFILTSCLIVYVSGLTEEKETEKVVKRKKSKTEPEPQDSG